MTTVEHEQKKRARTTSLKQKSSMGQSFAKTLGSRDIRVNCLLIGPVDTPEFFELLPPEWQDKEKISEIGFG